MTTVLVPRPNKRDVISGAFSLNLDKQLHITRTSWLPGWKRLQELEAIRIRVDDDRFRWAIWQWLLKGFCTSLKLNRELTADGRVEPEWFLAVSSDTVGDRVKIKATRICKCCNYLWRSHKGMSSRITVMAAHKIAVEAGDDWILRGKVNDNNKWFLNIEQGMYGSYQFADDGTPLSIVESKIDFE